MPVTSLSTKGQIVIPKEIRDALGLKPGSVFMVRLEGRNIVLEPSGTDLGERFFGRYRDAGLLEELERERQRELAREKSQ